MTLPWKQNVVAELVHGPADGREITLPPSDKDVEVIEVPILKDITSEPCQYVTSMEDFRPVIRLGIYRRDGSTLRLHSGAPATVKFRYKETRDDGEQAE